MLSSSHLREEYLRKKRNKKLVRYSVVFLALVFLALLTSYLAHRPSLRISKVELNGGVLVTQSDVSRESLNFLSGSYFWLFPKNNALWYPHSSLMNFLEDSFKRIDTIDIHLKGLKTLVVDITERKPVALWCDTLPPEPSSRCYFMDSNATLFAEAPLFSGDAYFKYYGLVSADMPIGKEYIASSTKFIELSDFIKTAKNLGLQPVYLVAKGDGLPAEAREFSLVLENGGQIYFDMKEPLTTASQNLEALLRTPALSSISPDKLPIDYIDLRYGNKLFYKLK